MRTEDEKDGRKTKEQEFPERSLITGMINSTEFLKRIRPSLDGVQLGSRSAEMIAVWCVEYFDKYHEAPERNIENIFYAKKEAKEIPSNMIEEIEENLEDLALEYDESFNVDYAVDAAEQHLRRRRLEAYNMEMDQLIEAGDLDAAEELAKGFTSVNGICRGNLDEVIYTSDEFIKLRISKPPTFVWPWLTAKTVNTIFGPRGAGKTWLGLILAVNLTRKNDGELPDIGPWKIRQSASTLYVDAELGNFPIQERVRELCKPFPPEDPENPLLILTGEHFAAKFDTQLVLSKQIREDIRAKLKANPGIKVLIMDNASALVPGVDENAKGDWDEFNQWMIGLKNMGIAVIMIHHAGKNPLAGSRGHSSREDPMDYIIEIREHKDHTESDYAWFTCKFTKSRNLRPGEPKNEFALRIVDHPDGGLCWEEDNQGTRAETKEMIMEDLLTGEKKQSEIAEDYNVSRGRVSQIKRECIGLGYLRIDNRKGKKMEILTEKGEDFLGRNDG